MTRTHSQLDAITQVTILGPGLLGGSVGLGLRRAGYTGRIVGVSRRKCTLDAATSVGCIDSGSHDLADALPDSQLVIVCSPVGMFPACFQRIAKHDHADLIITDVGSTKVSVAQAAHEYLPDPTRFVGSHPMAGGEQHGPLHAQADLFAGKPCIICAEDDTNAHALAVVEELWERLGMRLLHMSALDADEQVAKISHLPHAVAVLLVNLAAKQGGLDVASTGFRDTTRVASGDPGIWADIFEGNREASMHAVDSLIGELHTFRQLLASEDRERMVELLERCKAVRDNWLEDRPGL